MKHQSMAEAREKLVKRMLGCSTIADVEAARDARDEWLLQYPEDFKIVQAGSSVEKLAGLLGMLSNQERLAAKRAAAAK